MKTPPSPSLAASTSAPRESSDTTSARQMLWIVAGFSVWAVAFVALYGVNAIGCEFGWNPSVQRGILVALWIVHLLVLSALLRWAIQQRARRVALQEPAPLLQNLAVGLTVTALAATALSLAPLVAVTMCVP